MQKKIGILVTATWRFIDFVPQLLEGIKNNFLTTCEKQIFLFTDHRSYFPDTTTIIIDHEKFPDITLNRYERYNNFSHLYDDLDFLFHLDADMSVVAPVTEDILKDTDTKPIIAITHPLFYSGGGSWEMRRGSTAFTPAALRKIYFCGGFQGGTAAAYLEACKILSERINTDKANGIMAEWHDESHWNRYCADHSDELTVLDAGYCYPQEKEIPFEKRVVALHKDKSHYRQ